MNREIKFRAWDKETEKMILFGLFQDEGFIIGLGNKDITDEMPIMYYTGLKDKNGKEIYEGDIVQVIHIKENGSIRKYLLSIEYSPKMLGLRVRLFIPKELTNGFNREAWKGLNWLRNLMEKDQKSIEVIGNIYENPELSPNPTEK